MSTGDSKTFGFYSDINKTKAGVFTSNTPVSVPTPAGGYTLLPGYFVGGISGTINTFTFSSTKMTALVMPYL